MKVRPVEFSLVDKVGSKAREHLDQTWMKALTRIEADPDGAVALIATGRWEQVGKTKNKPRLVAHAEGCGPFDEVADWRPIQIAMSGGDDF